MSGGSPPGKAWSFERRQGFAKRERAPVGPCGGNRDFLIQQNGGPQVRPPIFAVREIGKHFLQCLGLCYFIIVLKRMGAPAWQPGKEEGLQLQWAKRMGETSVLSQENSGKPLATEEQPWYAALPGLTEFLVEAHYGDYRQDMRPYLAPDVVWLGAMEGQYADTAEGMLAILDREKGIRFEIKNAAYQLVDADERCATVFGSLQVRTAEGSGLVLAFRQRVTFQYRRTGEGPKAVHIHVSNDWQVKEANEPLPFRAGKETYRYVQEILRRSQATPRKLVLQDVHGRRHILMESEVVFAEAQRTHSVVYSVNGPIELCEKLCRLARRLPGLLRVHRSYLVNPDYVVGVSRCALHLCDGYTVPVPAQRYTKIRAEIEKHTIGAEKCTIGAEAVDE